MLNTRRLAAPLDHSSGRSNLQSARALCVQPVVAGFPGPSARPASRPESSWPAASCAPSRPSAGPCTILCSSLSKERKKLAKALKSHRKVLERRLSALTATEVDSPVLSELLTELRTLTSRLEDQRAVGWMYARDGYDSSDSDDDCPARPAASLTAQRHRSCSSGCSGPSLLALPSVEPTADTASSQSTHAPAPSGSPASSTLVVSGLSGQVELPVPEPQEGWDWSEEDYRAAKFEGAGGRVMVCTGSKCQRKGGTEVLRAVSALSEGNPNIEVVPCKCVGKCSAGAAMRVRPQGQPCATYTQVRPGQLRDVFSEHFAEPGRPQADSVACCSDCVAPRS